jgi:S-adenosylmethionine:tRNA ribosyltransferase-isomerase
MHFVEGPELSARVAEHQADGSYVIQLTSGEPATSILQRLGRMPLPPYIKRDRRHEARDEADRLRYQTVYARIDGSIAAPTSGMHFSERLLAALASRQIDHCFVTLHVGPGTFKPITADTLEGHVMHSEIYALSSETADVLNRARKEDRRIIPVGTTACRVLESQPLDRPFEYASGQTSLFIRPPYTFARTSGLITNFHLPRSTLIALVAALVGVEEQRRIYRIAIENRYRFFSYGDAMLIE